MKSSTPMQNYSLEDWFSVLRPTPPRDPQDAKQGEINFLMQARLMTRKVSKTRERRHIWWIDRIKKRIYHKEFSPMYATLASIVLVLALMFGGSGATVLAAQTSLPDQPLYRIKTFSEDIALRYSQEENQRLQMELEYTNRRVDEMVAMSEMGVEPPETVLERLEKHLDQVVALAARAEEAEMTRILSQIRDRLRQQIRSLDEAQEVGQLMTRTMEAVQIRLRWAELGLNEPAAFQAQARFRNQFSEPPEFGEGPGYGPGPNPNDGSSGFGPGPGSKLEPPDDRSGPHMDGDPSGYSTGPGPGSDQEPGPDSDSGQESEDSGYQAGPNQDAGQNPDNGGDNPKPGCEQNCTDQNTDPGSKKDESNQNSERGSGKGDGNKP